MKKLFVIAGVALVSASASFGLSLTVSNVNNVFTGAYAVSSSGYILFDTNNGATPADDGFAVVGKMTLSNSTIASLYASGNVPAIIAGFQQFATTLDISNFGAGAFQSIANGDTKASMNTFGGSSIYLWVFKGSTLAGATEHLIVQLGATFLTDPEVGAALSQDVYLRPTDVASVVVGGYNNYTHDFGMGSGPLPGYNTVQPAPEPSTALLLVGMSAALAFRRRR